MKKVLHNIAFGKIKSFNLLKALRHNLREYEEELQEGRGINPHRTQFNKFLRGDGSALDLFRQFNKLAKEGCNKTMRKDLVIAVEALFTLPSDSGIDEEAYFADSIKWFEQHSGGQVISAVIHNDEKEPHCHALLLPLINGCMVGSKVMGNKRNLSELKQSHFEEVASKYGIQSRKSLTTTEKRMAAAMIWEKVKSNPSVLNQSSISNAFIRVLEKNPNELMAHLNIQLDYYPAPKRSFVSTMISKGKGGNFQSE